jgi:hypothetical protein
MRALGALVWILVSFQAFAMLPSQKKKLPPPQAFTFSPGTIYGYTNVLGLPAMPALKRSDNISTRSAIQDAYHDRIVEWTKANQNYAVPLAQRLQKKPDQSLAVDIVCQLSPIDWLQGFEDDDYSDHKCASLILDVVSHVFKIKFERFKEGKIVVQEEPSVTNSFCNLFIRHLGSPRQVER